MAISELFMVDAHQVKHGSMEIMHTYRILDGIVSEFICFAIHRSWFDSTACHPDAEALGMVVASVVGPINLTLTVIGATKFATPDHQRFIEQSSLLQVLDQACRSPVYVFCLHPHVIDQVAMGIPSLVIELYKTNTRFRKLSGQQTVGCIGSWNKAIRAIHFDGVVRLLAEVGQFRHRTLHAV